MSQYDKSIKAIFSDMTEDLVTEGPRGEIQRGSFLPHEVNQGDGSCG